MSKSGDDAQGKRTVFGAPDQEQMISKLDAVSDDDLSSEFFDGSLQDGEDSGVRMFDVGIRTLTDDASAPVAAFGARSAGSAAQRATAQPLATGAVGRFEDPVVRRAFILGGPAAIPA